MDVQRLEDVNATIANNSIIFQEGRLKIRTLDHDNLSISCNITDASFIPFINVRLGAC